MGMKERMGGKITSEMVESRMEKRMDKEHILFLMAESMLGNSRMGYQMVKENILILMEQSM